MFNIKIKDFPKKRAVKKEVKEKENKTKVKEDPWGNKYEFYIYTYSGLDATSMPGLVIISSYGKDSVSNKAEYKNGDYGDDVIAIINPN